MELSGFYRVSVKVETETEDKKGNVKIKKTKEVYIVDNCGDPQAAVDVVEDGNMKAVTSNAVADGLNEVMPTGTILPGMWQTAPKGFLLCNGDTYQTSQYPGLASVLGATGDTFKVPDLREVVLVGVGQNSTFSIATHDVYTLGQFKDDQLQKHTHSYSRPDGSQTLDSGTHYAVYRAVSANTGTNTGRTGDTNTTHGKQFGVNYIIKY